LNPANNRTPGALALGVCQKGEAIAEKILKYLYNNVKRMPTCYSGYDFICDNIKIDVKTSSLHFKKTYVNKFRTMNTCKNNNTDIFLCIGYDNRKDLNIKHIWLFPKELGNYRQSINIHDSEKYLQKFKRYEITEKVKYIIKKE